MSTTFSVMGAKVSYTKIPCTYGAGEEWACSEAERCGYCDNGMEDVRTSDAPEANFSNVNAGRLLLALGVMGDPSYGEVKAGDIPAFRRAIVRALNKDMSPLATPFSHTKRPGKDEVFQMEVTEESFQRRFEAVDAICKVAQEREVGIHWS